ncbi:cupin domain-containing protein [Ceratobasidium sp. AG-Ba]|nr:cupin domain-containing protein [Ceratobasidium sp. AG-Ba]
MSPVPSDVTKLTPLPNPRRVVTANNPETGIGELLFDDTPQTQASALLQCNDPELMLLALPITLRDLVAAYREDAGPKSLEGLIVPNGSNLRVTDLGPRQKTPMHRTTSVDYNIIISGHAVHVLEDGSEQQVGPGDVVVQRGTNHRWENRTDEWVRWISVLIYANPIVLNGKELEPLMESE